MAAAIATSGAHAGPLEQAKRIHDRLAGVPPSEDTLLEMSREIRAGRALEAANMAMMNDGFYNVTVKNWAAPWTNRDFDVFTPLNDYMATVIGLVRDSETYDFREVLYGDHLYVAGSGVDVPPYSNTSNAHYEQLEDGGYSLQTVLEHRSQSAVTGLPADATSGVVTSRASAKAFLIAGTNRAAFRFTLMNHLCMDLEQVHDVTRVPDRIRQDVSRSPGGDSRVFLNNCIGCHAGMDPLAQSLAYYDFAYDADGDPFGDNGQIEYNVTDDPETGSRVQPKYYNNEATFPQGFRTPNDEWVNYWREGQNAVLNWDTSLPGSGQGARSMFQELAHSEAFASCAVRKVFKTVCLRDPQDQADLDQVETIQASFVGGGYDIKSVFAQSAVYCSGS
jgi:hypothetical protein